MAEEKKEEGAEGTEETAPKKSSKKLFIIIGAVVALIIAAGVPVFLMSRNTEPKETAELSEDAAEGHDGEAEGSADEEELLEGEEPLGAIFPLETFVVNLTGNRYIRMQAQLEFVSRDIPKRFYGKIIPIRDRIISMLSSKSQDDLQTAQNKDRLKAEIKDIVNEILKKEEIKQVYFSQFIVQ